MLDLASGFGQDMLPKFSCLGSLQVFSDQMVYSGIKFQSNLAVCKKKRIRHLRKVRYRGEL